MHALRLCVVPEQFWDTLTLLECILFNAAVDLLGLWFRFVWEFNFIDLRGHQHFDTVVNTQCCISNGGRSRCGVEEIYHTSTPRGVEVDVWISSLHSFIYLSFIHHFPVSASTSLKYYYYWCIYVFCVDCIMYCECDVVNWMFCCIIFGCCT